MTRTVSSHTRNGRPVRAYRQGGRSAGQNAVDGGLGALASAGVLTSVVLDTVGLVIEVGALLFAAIFGVLLGVRFYKRIPLWKRSKFWGRQRARFKPRRMSTKRRSNRPPATKQHDTAPWAGAAAWAGDGGRNAVWRVEGGVLRKVSR